MTASDRDYDIALLGATGFTGRLTAEYLARNAPSTLRWAVAGRDRSRLQELAAEVSRLAPDAPPVGVLTADIGDEASLSALARATGLLASTVGPYLKYGAPVVAACAHAGTDYVDITGEPEFVDQSWLDHQARAVETGARLVHSCGFDSMPHDLGAWWTLRHLPGDVPVAMTGYVRASGAISTGTYQSAVGAFARVGSARATAARRRELEVRPAQRRVASLPSRPHREPGSGRWAVPLPTIDPVVVRRSARALPEYGPDFRYGHFLVAGGLVTATAVVTGAAGVFALAQLGPTRKALLALRTPGGGPSEDRRSQGWFSVSFVATAGDVRVTTAVSGGDPGYDETATMLAEAALCLALDPLPALAGQLTTAQAMGQPLVDRLQRAGIHFRLVSR